MSVTDVAEDVVWRGAEQLRPFLVPIDSLEPFPGNPRRGDIERLRQSLRRFGQVLPALADPTLAADGRLRLIARHHLTVAATEEGWSHIAVIAHDFGDEDEARGYLIADNRLGQLGGYDDEELASHLRHLHELDALEGTGYTADDHDDLLARLRKIHAEDAPPMPPSETPREQRDKHVKELVLLYGEDRLAQLEIWMGVVAHEKGTSGPSETLYAAAEVAAATLNQGT